MGSVTLRPTADISTANCTYTSASLWQTVSDVSDSSYALAYVIHPDTVPPFYGDGSTANVPTVALANATGTVPAGRQIMSWSPWIRGRKSGTVGSQSASCATSSWRVSTDQELTLQSCSEDGTRAIQSAGTTTLTFNTVTGLPWTYADIDGIKCVLGAFNTYQIPGETYDVWMVVNYSDLPSVPTSITPATGTITVPSPTLGGTMGAIASGQSQKMEWQFATDSGFTANVKTITESAADLRASGATTESPGSVNLYLTNGTWYLRARAIDEYGIAGSYSATNTVTVNVPVLPTPTAVTPASGATVTTMVPTFGGTLTVDGSGRTEKMEWNIATDSGFTTNLISLVESNADLRASGATTEILPRNINYNYNFNYSAGTTWYLRGRAIGSDSSVSAWTATTSFTLSMSAPPTPTLITPAQGATSNTSTPTLGATLSAATESRAVKARWQLATDTAFTANVRTITESNTDLRTSGATTEAVTSGSKLFQGLWYIRACAVDEYGQVGSYSSYTSFTVSHPPASSPQSPIANAKVVWAASTAFDWDFSDTAPTDAQTAYQIIVERNDTGAVLYDTNKVVNATTAGNVAISATYKDVLLRWKIRVWDSDDVAGTYSAYQLFLLSDVPVVTITSPTNGQAIGSGVPTVTWTLDGTTTQVSRRLVFKRTSDNVVVYDSGSLVGTPQTYTAPTTILENLKNYSVTVTVVDQNGMSGSAVRNFSTSYTGPVAFAFTVTATNFDDLGYVTLSWPAAIAEGLFVSWNVYRKTSIETSWIQIYSTNDSSVKSYKDWSAANNEVYNYAITQSAVNSGTTLEGPILSSSDITVIGTHYWLISPDDESFNLRLSQVKDDGFSDAYDEAELIIIGRGRKINHGTRLGYDGSLTIELRDDTLATAREKRLMLEGMRALSGAILLRNPFGDVIQVSLGSPSFTRLSGVGTNEFLDATLPYKEVF